MRWSSIKYLFLLFILGCQNNGTEIDESLLGLNYYPVEVGLYRIFDVESINYNLSGIPDTINYQLKEVYSEEFEDLEGGLSYKLERYKRDSLSDDWVIDSVWVARKDIQTATQVENNIPLIKLSFPIEENRIWDANSLNANEPDEYQLIDVNQPVTLKDTVEFPKTSTVIQEETLDNILFRNIRKEIFAEGVGLIYKQLTLLNFCADVDCLGQDIIESGIDYKQELVDYGVE